MREINFFDNGAPEGNLNLRIQQTANRWDGLAAFRQADMKMMDRCD